MAKIGRPKLSEQRVKPVIRSVAFPPDVYERIKEIAALEERDVTSQLVKISRDFIAKYDKESGNSKPQPRAA